MAAEELAILLNAKDGFSSTFAKLDRTVAGSVGRFGAAAQQMGRSMTTYITAPVVGLGILAAKAAMDFESSFAGIKKTVDGTAVEFAQMSKEIRQLSKEIPVSVNELNKYGEMAGQLGIKKKNIMGFIRVIADLGATTNLTGEQGASSLARFANIVKMNQKHFKNLGSTIVALGNAGASTETEIMDMALRLAGAGKVVKMTEPQILGFAAALSSVGIEAEAGGSAFSKLFVELASAGGAKLGQFGKVAGMTGKQFKQAFKDDAAGATISFVEGLKRIQESGGDLFGVLENLGITEVRMRDALLRAAGAGDLMNNMIDRGTKSWKENNALTEEAQKRYKTLESKMEILQNKVIDVAIDIGNILIPHLSTVADKVDIIVTKFQGLDKESQNTILKMVGGLAVGGPLLIGLGMVASAISKIIGLFSNPVTGLIALTAIWFAAWKGSEAWAKAKFGAVGEIINTLVFGPLAMLIKQTELGIALLVKLYNLFNNPPPTRGGKLDKALEGITTKMIGPPGKPPTLKPKAHGGWASGPIMTGEKGPELVLPHNVSSFFQQMGIPIVAPASTRQQSTVHTHVYLDGKQVAESVDYHFAGVGDNL